MRAIQMSVATLALAATLPAQAALIQHTSLSSFDAAADNPPVVVDFDTIATGTNVTGATFGGATLGAPGAALIVVAGSGTSTPSGFSGAPNPGTNVLIPTSGTKLLSPGGAVLGPGPDPAVENDDLEIGFVLPVAAFGLDLLYQSADCCTMTSIRVFDAQNALLGSFDAPTPNPGAGGGVPGGTQFWGIVADGPIIGRILVDEMDGNDEFPDANLGFDTLRFSPVPLPAAGWLLLGALPVLARRRRRA